MGDREGDMEGGEVGTHCSMPYHLCLESAQHLGY